MTRRDRLILALITAAGFLCGALVAVQMLQRAAQPPQPDMIGIQSIDAQLPDDLVLFDRGGRQRRFVEFRGTALLVVLTEGRCIDLCSQNLQLISAALDRLKPGSIGLEGMLITPGFPVDFDATRHHHKLQSWAVDGANFDRLVRVFWADHRYNSATAPPGAAAPDFGEKNLSY